MSLADRGLFEAPAACDCSFPALHPSLDDPRIGEDGYQRLQEVRVQFQMLRIQAEMEHRGTPLERSTRGSAHAIICFTALDPADRTKLLRFPAVSRAAEFVHQKCDNVCQAIRRQGTCGGHRFGYVSELPHDWNEPNAVRLLVLQLKDKSAARPADYGRAPSPRHVAHRTSAAFRSARSRAFAA